MAIAVVPISARQVELLLLTEEGHFQEAKSLDVKPASFTKILSAFANADGGELFVGLDEDPLTRSLSWRGFANQEAANGHLQTLGDFFPLGQEVDYEFLSAEGESGLVLHVTVHKSGEIKPAISGEVYVRRGAQSLPVRTDAERDRLERNKGLKSFETATVAAGEDIVTNSEVIIRFMLDVVPSAEPKPWLQKQLLLVADKPTVGGVVLFSDEPQAALPKRCAIKIYRYKTTEPQGIRETLAFDPITIEGCLYDQIHAAVTRTVELIEEVSILTGGGMERIQYPLETLHEIITNAVLHRDYAIADDVHVRIFDNRVEVESPGRLPAHVTPKNILDERFARNGQIVRLINKFPEPPNKDVGEGLNTAFAAMKRLQLKDPVIAELENSVVVYIRHQRLGTPEEQILEYLQDHEEITNKQVRAMTGIGSENKVKTIFQRLMAANQIERVPGRGGGAAAYRRPVAEP